MSAVSGIALLGFGEVNQILADDLSADGRSTLSAWDTQFHAFDSVPSRALRGRNVRGARDAADVVLGADLVISAVTASQVAIAARSVVTGLSPGTWYLDLNSASPSQKKDAAQVIEAMDARYVEAAVMSPIAPKRSATTMLLGGPHAEEFLPIAKSLGFAETRFFSGEIGKAAAAKLCRSVMVKGMEALLGEALVSARRYGVEETVLASLDDLFPGPEWTKLAHYMISRSIQHGVRRAEEMHEAARTIQEAGLEPLMSLACAKRQDWAAQFQSALSAKSLPESLDAILAAMTADKTQRCSR